MLPNEYEGINFSEYAVAYLLEYECLVAKVICTCTHLRIGMPMPKSLLCVQKMAKMAALPTWWGELHAYPPSSTPVQYSIQYCRFVF